MWPKEEKQEDREVDAAMDKGEGDRGGRNGALFF
jgi:hypothetical protein